MHRSQLDAGGDVVVESRMTGRASKCKGPVAVGNMRMWEVLRGDHCSWDAN